MKKPLSTTLTAADTTLLSTTYMVVTVIVAGINARSHVIHKRARSPNKFMNDR
jgi:hypothetical protein